MTGLQDTQRICQGQSLKRADPTQECVNSIIRQAMDLADIGPEDLMALAQTNIPVEPGPGQAIGFPIPNIGADEFLAFVQVYRRVFASTPHVPEADLNWDPIVLYRTALGLTIAAHAAMFAGQSLMQFTMGKSDFLTDLKLEDLACPKDIICTMNDCKGQVEKTDFGTGEVSADMPIQPICYTVRDQTFHQTTSTDMRS
jgi:hypothetical protein